MLISHRKKAGGEPGPAAWHSSGTWQLSAVFRRSQLWLQLVGRQQGRGERRERTTTAVEQPGSLRPDQWELLPGSECCHHRQQTLQMSSGYLAILIRGNILAEGAPPPVSLKYPPLSRRNDRKLTERLGSLSSTSAHWSGKWESRFARSFFLLLIKQLHWELKPKAKFGVIFYYDKTERIYYRYRIEIVSVYNILYNGLVELYQYQYYNMLTNPRQ